MAIFEGFGISVDANVIGRVLRYTVTNQTPEATEIIKFLKVLTDEQSEYNLRSNLRPSYKKSAKRFFVRGTEVEHNAKLVKTTFVTANEANEALAALGRLIARIQEPEIEQALPIDELDAEPDGVPSQLGSVAHIRFKFINREMAQKLQLTNSAIYPRNVIEWSNTKAMVLRNPHWNEHAQQCIDCLNKSILPDNNKTKTSGNVINPHVVSVQQAKAAVDLLESCFQYALENDILIAWWRLVSCLRSPDTLFKSYNYKKHPVVKTKAPILVH